MGSGLAGGLRAGGAGSPARGVPGLTARFEANDRDFPGGIEHENPPAHAGGHGFDPWSGKIPHATEHLSLCATMTEACPLLQKEPLQ